MKFIYSLEQGKTFSELDVTVWHRYWYCYIMLNAN